MIPDKSQAPDFAGKPTTSATAELVLVLTTWPPDADIEAVARQLLARHLAACVTVLPTHRAIYHWNDAIETADERQLLIKTTRDCVAALQTAVHAAHPYEVPEWLELPVSAASDAYGAWVTSSCRVPDASPDRQE